MLILKLKMISVPGLTNEGIRSKKLVELVDIFATLVEATGFEPLEICPTDSSKIHLCTEGSSLIPLINNLNLPSWKKAVFWQYPRGGSENHVPRCMGYSILSQRYHYTEWVKIKVTELPNYEPDWENECDHYELYDLETDPQENLNLYENIHYIHLRKELSKRLRAGWRNEINAHHQNYNYETKIHVTIEIL